MHKYNWGAYTTHTLTHTHRHTQTEYHVLRHHVQLQAIETVHTSNITYKVGGKEAEKKNERSKYGTAVHNHYVKSTLQKAKKKKYKHTETHAHSAIYACIRVYI